MKQPPAAPPPPRCRASALCALCATSWASPRAPMTATPGPVELRAADDVRVRPRAATPHLRLSTPPLRARDARVRHVWPPEGKRTRAALLPLPPLTRPQLRRVPRLLPQPLHDPAAARLLGSRRAALAARAQPGAVVRPVARGADHAGLVRHAQRRHVAGLPLHPRAGRHQALRRLQRARDLRQASRVLWP
eukprot:6019187-Prymnesium_polylepis.1